MPGTRGNIEADGFSIIENVLSEQSINRLLAALGRINQTDSIRSRGGVFAVRNLLDLSREVRELAESEAIRSMVEPVLGTNSFPVRGILFDKIPHANWTVPWHQDLTIAVRSRVEAEGFGPWSVKADVLHVQPPAWVLENMLAVRMHLDPCGPGNGPLRIICGSHRHGRIAEASIAGLRENSVETVCEVGAGGVLLMRPLLLHASSPSRVPAHRRVIHLDFASTPLPDGMQWLTGQY